MVRNGPIICRIVAAASLRDMLAGGRRRDAKTIAALSTYFWREKT